MASETHRVQGADVHVWRQGEGRPLLMLHGNPDSHRVWLPLIERLPAGIEAIAPDLPGFGASGVPAVQSLTCLLYTSPSPRDLSTSRMPSSA